MVRLIFAALLLASFVVPAAGCTPEPALSQPQAPSGEPVSGEATIVISGFAYALPTMQVTAGTKVTWTNNDSVAHTVTSDDKLFESPSLRQGDSFTYTFDKAGSFSYHCAPHPRMVGKIVVR